MILWSFPIATAGLGLWQVYRYQWKLNLIKEAKENLEKEPLQEPTTEKYRRIFLNGQFEDGKILVNGVEHGERGKYIIRPYLLNNKRYLVQQGFTTTDSLASTSDLGLIMSPEKQGYRPNNTKETWFWKDISSLSKLFNTEPILIGMVESPTHPTGISTVPNFTNNHMNYIITWFSTSLLTAIMIKTRHKAYFRK